MGELRWSEPAGAGTAGGKTLTANLTGYRRYRIGDWRMVAEIRDEELVIVAIGLGQRSEIYRQQ